MQASDVLLNIHLVHGNAVIIQVIQVLSHLGAFKLCKFLM